MKVLFDALTEDEQTIVLWAEGMSEIGRSPFHLDDFGCMFVAILPTLTRIRVALAGLKEKGWIHQVEDNFYVLS